MPVLRQSNDRNPIRIISVNINVSPTVAIAIIKYTAALPLDYM